MRFRARETKGIKERGAESGSSVFYVKRLIAFRYKAVFLISGIITRGQTVSSSCDQRHPSSQVGASLVTTSQLKVKYGTNS